MDELTESMHYSRGERIAIIAIVAVIAIVIILIFTPLMQRKPVATSLPDIDSLLTLRQEAVSQHEEEKMAFDAAFAESSVAAIKLTPFPFNPNGLSTEKWKELGLTDKQIRSIKNYEMKGGKFYTKEDFRRMYLISDEEYKILEPYIVIPKEKYRRVEEKTVEKPKQTAVAARPLEIVNINKADSATFTLLPGIGAWSAHRIIEYRNRLGGFVDVVQLTEIKGIDSSRFSKIEKWVVTDGEVPQRLEINEAEFSQLLKHPYLNYSMVKSIVNYRDRRGLIKDYEQLLQIVDEKPNPMIEKYLSY